MGLSKQGYWSGLPFPTPRDLPNSGTEPAFPASAGGYFITEPAYALNGNQHINQERTNQK